MAGKIENFTFQNFIRKNLKKRLDKGGVG